jgi:hypothetical protein
MREEILRDLARRAATDREFLRSAREDLAGTLVRYGYDLTAEELAAVEDVRRRTAGMGDGDVVRALMGGLERRPRASIERPAAPGRRGAGPARPGRPGAPRGR